MAIKWGQSPKTGHLLSPIPFPTTEALAKEIASGEWVDIPGIGKVQVSREEGKGYLTSITSGGQLVRRKVKMRLRTKIRLYEKFKKRCRN